VERPGEEERFKPYAALGNQQLLWHGSRLTNFMGILSQVGFSLALQRATPCLAN
jgi:poly [ADP-ribose] polymerase